MTPASFDPTTPKDCTFFALYFLSTPTAEVCCSFTQFISKPRLHERVTEKYLLCRTVGMLFENHDGLLSRS